MKVSQVIVGLVVCLLFINSSIWVKRARSLKNATPEELMQCLRTSPFLQKEINNLSEVTVTWIDRNQLPDELILLLLVSEDRRFYEHPGVDFFRILKIVIDGSLFNEQRIGGSTLTQQLIKTLWGSPRRTFIVKFNEMIGALILERCLTKDEILELYINCVVWSPDSVGLLAGIQSLYHKDVEDLTLEEMISLVAGLPNPKSHWKFVKNNQKNRRFQNRIEHLEKEVNLLGIEEIKTLERNYE